MKKPKSIYIIGAVVIGILFMLVAFLILIASGVFDMRSKLVFSSGDIEKYYDGTALTCDEWMLVNGELKDGHIPNVVVYGSRTDAGVSPNKFSVRIVDEKGKDITNTYSIEYRPGDLHVLPRVIKIGTGSASKDYDGTVLTCDTYNIIEENLLPSHKVAVHVYGERTEAGVGDNEFNAVVTDENDNNVTHNYDIVKLCGSLEILKRRIVLQTPSVHSIYDGTPVMREEWKYISDTQVLSGHEIKVVVSGSRIDAGVSSNSITEVRISEGTKNVTANYEIICDEGELVVAHREITIRSEDASKNYDGTPLTNKKWNIVSLTQPVDKHTVTAVVSGAITEPGQTFNCIAEVVVMADTGKNVSLNYQIKIQTGILTVIGPDRAGAGGVVSLVGSSCDSATTGGGSPESVGTELDDSGKIGLPEISGGEGGGDGEIPVAARVNSGVTGKIYLRHKSFGDYYGSGWNNAADYPYLLDSKYSLNYLSGITLKNAGYESNRVLIDVLGSQYLLPSYLDTYESSYRIQTSDVVYSGDTGAVYSVYYYLFDYLNKGLNPSGLGIYTEAERQYNEYVKQNYLSLPGKTNTFLQQIITEKGFNKNNPDIIHAVANYIQNAAVYNIKYDRMLDKTDDIVTGFLGVYKEGICQHYASAAVMLYRALGIPARYAIGYLGNTEAGEWVDIPGDNAHAWAEVYIGGVGWVQVEVTGAGPGFDGEGDGNGIGGNGGGNGGNGNNPQGKPELNIKPLDLWMKYRSGAVLEAGSSLQGLTALIEKGYRYDATVTGRQTAIGIGFSTITSFVLYNSAGDDVTDDYHIKFSKGKLHLYAKEITIGTESMHKIYDGTPLIPDTDKYTLKGTLFDGHSFAEIKAAGSQTKAGVSENKLDIIIADEAGKDVTDIYKINWEYGTLTVEARPITVKAGSASKPYDGIGLKCGEYEIVSELDKSALLEGDYAIINIAGEQKEIGRSQNKIESIQIFDKSGNEVTANYSIQLQNGWLTVTPAPKTVVAG